jgi:peroxiredoxin
MEADVPRIAKTLLIALLAVGISMPVSCFAVPQKGKPAPDIRVVTISGQRVSLAGYQGRVVVVEFFATWCEGCKISLPHLISLNSKYGKQGLQVLGLNPGIRGDTPDVVRSFIREKKINFPVALVDDDLLIDYGIQPIPAIFIIDKRGVLVQKFIGFNAEIQTAMETTIKSLLAQ